MTRKSLNTLNRELGHLGMDFPAGSIWKHMPSGSFYEIVGVSARESDGEYEVVYRPAPCPNQGPVVRTVGGIEYDATSGDELLSNILFHRPVSEWKERVITDEYPSVCRFVHAKLVSSYVAEA